VICVILDVLFLFAVQLFCFAMSNYSCFPTCDVNVMVCGTQFNFFQLSQCCIKMNTCNNIHRHSDSPSLEDTCLATGIICLLAISFVSYFLLVFIIHLFGALIKSFFSCPSDLKSMLQTTVTTCH